MSNKEKFLSLVSGVDTQTQEKNRWRIENRAWLRISQKIAAQVLLRLDELHWSQKNLAEHMGCSPQFVHTILKGSENLTLETISKLEKALRIELIQVVEQREIKIVTIIDNIKYFPKNISSKYQNTHETLYNDNASSFGEREYKIA